MRTSPYSIDLRNKVVDFIQKGKSQKEASSVFGIHKNTINRWIKRLEQEGNVSAKLRLDKRSKLDHITLQTFVIANPNNRLKDVAL